ncbi:hypothetical protein FPV67DRAFT_1667052 [Lyophyllum atratum]|nr:hypothetical protein FPV67DRAFT_1667052 [Lyophyllum atratum]
MARHFMNTFVLLTALTSVNAYWLMGIEDFITTERLDPIVNPGKVSGHAHSVLGGSNFRMNTNTAQLRNSECTSIPIPEDKSNYWFPHLYFQWSNGSFTSLTGGAVISCFRYYLFNDKPGTTTAFPDDFRMLSGDPTLRTYDPNSHAQQAITFLCLDFNGVTTRHNSLPTKACPSGIRAQVNFPSCWDGKNLDSPDHKSHVAFLSGGPDSGSCSDPNYPVTMPRIFIEVYWTSEMDKFRSQAKNSSQPYVYAYGDPTGYGYHADFLNGWDKGVLQKAVDECHCDIYGDPTCCVNKGIFHMNKGKQCRITKTIDEPTTGTLAKLPGNNPVQKEGVRATMFSDPNVPTLLAPVYAYTGDSPANVGKPIPPASGGPASSFVSLSSSSTRIASSSAPVPPSSSPVVAAPSASVPPSPPVASSVGSSPSSAPASPSGPTPPASGNSPGGHGTPPSESPPSVPVSSPNKPNPTTQAPPVPTSSGNCDDSEDVDDGNDDGEDGGGEDDNDGEVSPTRPPQTPTASVPPPTQSSAAPAPSSDDDYDDCDDDEQGGDDDNASPTSNTPLPSSGAGSNPSPSPSKPDAGPYKPPVFAPVPVTTLVAGGGQGNGVPQSPAPTAGLPPPVLNFAPMCPGGKFRHKHLREQKAQEQKRSVHHARLFHENSRRFMKPHVHVRAF